MLNSVSLLDVYRKRRCVNVVVVLRCIVTVDCLMSSTTDGEVDHCVTEAPRAPPRRRRKSRDSRSSTDRESESNPQNTASDAAQNPTASSSSSASSASSCDVIQTNQTATPAATRPANGWRVDVEQTDKENQWTSSYARPQFRTPSSPCAVRDNQLYLNSVYPRTTAQLQSETFPTWGNDALSELRSTSDNLLRSTDENYSKLNDGKKKCTDNNTDDVDVDEGDDDIGGDILASWKKKNVDDFRRHVINTNRQRYQNGSTYHTIVFEPVKVPEASATHSRPLLHDNPNHTQSAYQKFTVETEAKYRSACDSDEHDDVFETWTKNNEDFRPLHAVSNRNSQVDRTGPSFHTSCSSEPVGFAESFPTSNDSPSVSTESTKNGDAAINPPPESVDENRGVDDVASSDIEEEPPPDYSDDDDDDDGGGSDDIFKSWRKNCENSHPTSNGSSLNGLGNNWSGDGYRHNRKYHPANMAAECDNDFQMTSSMFASVCDADEVFTPSANGKRNGTL